MTKLRFVHRLQPAEALADAIELQSGVEVMRRHSSTRFKRGKRL